MGSPKFHDKPYDAGTLAKLKIFELYIQEWIPVFLSQIDPPFRDIHIFDFFSGPGKDSSGISGSPLLILSQLRAYYKSGLAGWDKVNITVHFFDEDAAKIEMLNGVLNEDQWAIPGVTIDCRPLSFRDALAEHERLLSSPLSAKVLIIDQFGVDEVSDDVFGRLINFPVSDFIFFLSSSTLYRFRDHPAIKQKIEKPEDSYDVHRAAVDYYRKLIPTGDHVFLGSFSIRKRSNIYGIVFGSRHPLGIHKFLRVAWKNDQFAGEANFDIERDNIKPGEGLLALDVMRPNKVRVFEDELEVALRSGVLKNEADVFRFCVDFGMTGRHSAPMLKKLKSEGVIGLEFQAPDVKKLKSPRPIRMRQ